MFTGSLGRTSQKESWWVRNPVSSPDQNWGESLLNAVATAGIRHLFSKCEALEVAIALPHTWVPKGESTDCESAVKV
ncbi:hypothetical protein [[Phormidium] sp. ETS-05]|uniref:hypothetical protein n=1 Tax=[Phormidium] sp. ETS-05 TaxID=222819 RepID=UPI0031FE5488